MFIYEDLNLQYNFIVFLVNDIKLQDNANKKYKFMKILNL